MSGVFPRPAGAAFMTAGGKFEQRFARGPNSCVRVRTLADPPGLRRAGEDPLARKLPGHHWTGAVADTAASGLPSSSVGRPPLARRLKGFA